MYGDPVGCACYHARVKGLAMAEITTSVDTLLAKALDELRTLPEAQVRQVLEAARVALEGAIRGSAQVIGTLTVTAGGQVDTVAATDECAAEVASPVLRRLLAELREWVPEKKQVTLVVLGVVLKCCADRLGVQLPDSQVVAVCPPPAIVEPASQPPANICLPPEPPPAVEGSVRSQEQPPTRVLP
jgi:hypothetical protein